MDLNSILALIQGHPRIKDAGMVLFHLGLVRRFNLEGRTVTALECRVDHDRAEAARQELLQRPGIVDIFVWLNSGRLEPGEPIMVAAVAGETRDQVFPVLQELIERLKKEASVKKEETLPDQ